MPAHWRETCDEILRWLMPITLGALGWASLELLAHANRLTKLESTVYTVSDARINEAEVARATLILHNQLESIRSDVKVIMKDLELLRSDLSDDKTASK